MYTHLIATILIVIMVVTVIWVTARIEDRHSYDHWHDSPFH